MRLDAHHHFWHYSPTEYAWIGPDMSALRRDFLPADLLGEIRSAGIDGVISVQSRQSEAETNWLLDLASDHNFICGVVGWAPLASPNVGDVLAQWTQNHPKLVAIRHVVQDEPDDEFLLRPHFNRGIALLKQFNLRYDVLIFERHLPAAIQFVDRHPNQIFILDHIAKPRIRAGELEPWRTNLRKLAERENVFCKVSGMVTEADWHTWRPETLRPYFDAALEAFTPRRLMFGSDWPVCLAACEYGKWIEVVKQWAAGLTPAEQNRLFGGTAASAYNILR